MTAGEAGAGLAAAEAITAGWFEERLCVNAGQLVKMIEVYPSAGSS